MFKSRRELKAITGVILSGGLGTRLRSIVPEKPKVLADVLGRPFLTYIFDQLMRAGIEKIVLSTGYKGEDIYKAIGDRYDSLEIIYSREEKPLGTGGALRKALDYLNSDPVLVLNGDSYINVDLKSYLNWFLSNERDVSLLLTRVSETDRFGQVRINGSNLVLSFEEKGLHQGPGWINAGVYFVKRHILLPLPPDKCLSLENDILPELVGKKILYGYPCYGEFIDIGTPESYKTAEAFFSKKIGIHHE